MLEANLEERRLKAEEEKLAIEREKLKIERSKAKWTTIPIWVALFALLGNIWATRQQAQSQMDIQAIQIAMNSKSMAEFSGKMDTIREMLPDFGSRFSSVNPESFKNYKPGLDDSKRLLFQQLGSQCKSKQEVIDLFNKLFPTPDAELYGNQPLTLKKPN